MIQVLLADNHSMFRQGLAKLLTSYGDVEVVGETTNDEWAVALAREKKPDVVIMQVQIPIERAKENLERMRREVSPPPKVIIVTMLEEPRYVREMMSVGASAYLVKSSSVEHLLAAIRAAVFDPNGRTWWWACRARCWRKPTEGQKPPSPLESSRYCCSPLGA